MANFEFYSSGEFGSQGQEYKPFEAEVYQKPQEIKNDTPEIAPTGEESRFAQLPTSQSTPQEKKKSVTGQGERRSKIKSLFDSISKSTAKVVGSVVGTVAAATSIVVVCTGLFASTPEVTPLYVEGGGNYVSYALDIQELDEQVDYDIVVSNSFDNSTFIEEDVVVGVNEHTVIGLQAGYEYQLSLVGDSDDATGAVTYYKTTFYTDRDGAKIESEYGATFERVPAEEAQVIWGDTVNEITLPLAFVPDEAGRFGYRIRLLDKDNRVAAEYIGREQMPTFEVSSAEDELYIQYEAVYLLDGKAKYAYDRQVAQEPLYLGAPEFIISDQKTLVSTGYYIIPYIIESKIPYEQIEGELIIHNEAWGEMVQPLGVLTTNQLYSFGVETDGTPGSFAISAKATAKGPYGGAPRVIETPFIQYENQIEIKPKVYLSHETYGDTIYFDFSVCVPDGTYLSLVDANTLEEIEVFGFYHSIEITDGQYAYTYQLMSPDGTSLVEAETVRFDTSLNPTYEFDYTNPGDLFVTYNEDGTINIYFDTNFACEDKETFYEISVKGGNSDMEFLFHGTEDILVVENLPFDNYYITYRVVCIKDDARYVLYEVIPSGGVEHMSKDATRLTYDGTLLSVDTSKSVMLGDTFTLIINGDNVFQFGKQDFVEQEGKYVFRLEVGEEIESAKLIYSTGPYVAAYETLCNQIGAEQIKGSIYRLAEIELGG